MSPRILVILVVTVSLAGLAIGSGCSKSSTSEASSESSSKSSTSSASSSGSSSGPSRYVRDVRDYTQEFVLSGGDFSAFRLGVGKIADKRGVSNWEQDKETYHGIGRGFKLAGISGQRLELLEKELSNANPESKKWMRKGYDSQKAS